MFASCDDCYKIIAVDPVVTVITFSFGIITQKLAIICKCRQTMHRFTCLGDRSFVKEIHFCHMSLS